MRPFPKSAEAGLYHTKAPSASLQARETHCGAFSQVIKVANEWRTCHEALDAFIAETQEVTPW